MGTLETDFNQSQPSQHRDSTLPAIYVLQQACARIQDIQYGHSYGGVCGNVLLERETSRGDPRDHNEVGPGLPGDTQLSQALLDGP